MACTAGASSGLPKGLLLVRAWTQAHSSPKQALVVTSQEELDQIREDRFREGIWNASRGALEWGAGAAAFTGSDGGTHGVGVDASAHAE